jgi:two-component system, chemotaxis family, protein-glutamate methylesterase/glutaminase
MIRVLLAEDSAVQRELLMYVIRKNGDFEIVGSATDGEQAVAQTEQLRPDVVLMDCQMPRLDGIAATRAIMERFPTPVVIMTGSLVRDAVSFAFDALENGALAVVAKPTAVGTELHDLTVDQLARTLRLMSAVKVIRRWPAPKAVTPFQAQPVTSDRTAQKTRIVALAGSTGAPSVLDKILVNVGAKTRVPLLIVQHMSDGFVDGFAAWLRQRTGMKIYVAQDGMEAEAGVAYIAPDGFHLGVGANGRLALSSEPPIDGFRPSATQLFRSVARAYGRASMGVLLTGMGRDGADGLLEMRKSGGLTVAQSEETCVVFGMPQEAIRLDAAARVLGPAEIAQLVMSASP